MATSMNNRSFVLPTCVSLLEAFYRNISGVYTTDFPDQPPLIFDYTNISNSFDQNLLMTPKSTSLRRLRFNSTFRIMLQNTA
ncbi:putative laccase [Helianthus anomalus]